MIKTFVIIILLLSSINIFGQDLPQMQVIGNGKYLQNETNDKNITDRKGNLCAVLIIETDLTELSYNSKNRVVKIEPTIGKTFLYLSPKDSIVTVYKTGFVPLEINLTDYGIKLESGTVWKIIIAEKLENNLLPVKINIAPENAVLFVDNEKKEIASVYHLSRGKHKIVMQKNGYKVLLDTINVSDENLSFVFELQKRNNSGNSDEHAMNNEMIFVEGGSFEMGDDDFGPIHTVLVNDFFISKYEITFDEYDKFCEATGREKPYDEEWGRGKHPVINVTWDDAKAYCEWAGGRLPTEAEWEYAAKGGKNSKSYTFSGSNNIDDVAWYDDNADGNAKIVGKKRANELGIYDMSGNVWEWCSDWFDEGYYSDSKNSNPKGPEQGRFRVLRGGSWFDASYACSNAYRYASKQSKKSNTIGFRIVTEVK